MYGVESWTPIFYAGKEMQLSGCPILFRVVESSSIFGIISKDSDEVAIQRQGKIIPAKRSLVALFAEETEDSIA
jgi:hypothetical protein